MASPPTSSTSPPPPTCSDWSTTTSSRRWATTGAGKAERGRHRLVHGPGRAHGQPRLSTAGRASSSRASTVTPDPSTSGSARWNLLEAYESQIKLNRTPAQALQVHQLGGEARRDGPSGSKALTRSSPARATCCSPTRRTPSRRRRRPSPSISCTRAEHPHPDAGRPDRARANTHRREAFLAYLFARRARTSGRTTGSGPRSGRRHRAPVRSTYAAKAPHDDRITEGGCSGEPKVLLPSNGIIIRIEAANGYTS